MLLFSCISSNNRNDFHVSMACYVFISRRQNYTPMNCFCSIFDKTNRILAIRRMCRGLFSFDCGENEIKNKLYMLNTVAKINC